MTPPPEAVTDLCWEMYMYLLQVLRGTAQGYHMKQCWCRRCLRHQSTAWSMQRFRTHLVRSWRQGDGSDGDTVANECA